MSRTSIKAALKHLDDGLRTRRFKGRGWARERIENARSPMREARRLVAWFRAREVEPDDAPDHSDVQELRVKLIRRQHFLDPLHARILARMDRLIAQGEMDRETFTAMASTVLSIPAVLPKSFRVFEGQAG